MNTLTTESRVLTRQLNACPPGFNTYTGTSLSEFEAAMIAEVIAWVKASPNNDRPILSERHY